MTDNPGQAAAATALADLLSNVHLTKEKFKLPTFSGRDAKGKDCKFNEWHYVYEKSIKDNTTLTSSDQQRLVYNSLAGEARARYLQLDNAKLTIQQIINRFEEIYSDQTSAVDRVEKFHELRQGTKESVTDFADRLEKIAHWVSEGEMADTEFYTSDTVLKTKFVRGLTDDSVAQRVAHIVDDNTKSFDYLRNRIANETSRSRRDSSPKRTKPTKAVSETTTDVFQKLLTRLESVETELKDMRKEQKSRPTQHNQRSHVRKKCDYCGRSGHLQVDCYAYQYQQKKKLKSEIS